MAQNIASNSAYFCPLSCKSVELSNAPINSLSWGFNPCKHQGEREEYLGARNTIPSGIQGKCISLLLHIRKEKRGGLHVCILLLKHVFTTNGRPFCETMISEIQVCTESLLFTIVIHCISFSNYFDISFRRCATFVNDYLH